MKRIGVVPAYGRDYKSKKAIQADLDAGKDFTITDIVHPDCGRYINKEQLIEGNYTEVNVRYQRQTKVAVLKVK